MPRMRADAGSVDGDLRRGVRSARYARPIETPTHRSELRILWYTEVSFARPGPSAILHFASPAARQRAGGGMEKSHEYPRYITSDRRSELFRRSLAQILSFGIFERHESGDWR